MISPISRICLARGAACGYARLWLVMIKDDVEPQRWHGRSLPCRQCMMWTDSWAAGEMGGYKR